MLDQARVKSLIDEIKKNIKIKIKKMIKSKSKIKKEIQEVRTCALHAGPGVPLS